MASTDRQERMRVIDTHTGGEPTRVIVEGGPPLGAGSMSERRDLFRERFDRYRTALLSEPRGSDVMVGALLVTPVDPAAAAGVIFFNNAGYLGMCGHGTIGAACALAHLGRAPQGRHRLETPVGSVAFRMQSPRRVTIENVPSYRLASQVNVNVPHYGPVTGDIAWGGNWFFLTQRDATSIDVRHVPELTALTTAIRTSLIKAGITGEGGCEIDHIELVGPPHDPANHGRSFVLCPGHAYDRSPCGTGTSAKLACLVADGKLQPGQVWRQESIVDSVFEGSVRLERGQIIPEITGSAFVNAETDIILDPDDPFCWGIPSS